MRIAIVGNGRMGKAIAAVAEDQGHTIHTVVTSDENPGGRALSATRLSGSDVAVEFTSPGAAVDNLEKLVALGIPTVTGTTGWYDALPRVAAWTRKHSGALLHSPNFSVGVHLFLRTARELAGLMKHRPEFAASIHEEHHSTKRDIPSGTALMLQGQLAACNPERTFPISSVREGSNPGTHTLSYDGPHEKIFLRHIAHDRGAFAAGALLAAQWLPGKTGVFTFEDLLFGPAA
jgi:4-hydroxy-tetrahydrodipicolinate reductase